ncbi:MAG: hypothetical protein IM574_11920 [Cytophagales bacterium]|nr:hypothetical protein [Cytophagales bacterium]MCA6404100.1 hypothetical protein [Cytophagales bacterium]MCA6415742.1 hypothetical protein [Cytophagales bacterium]MCA6420113.1 hypothetical protein [Cytophagales bacterium]MCA6426491.1 hypothetical protein [Cytophagales bacterium]
MRRTVLTILYLMNAGFLSGQTFLYPKLKTEFNSLLEIIPTKWTIIDSVSGDLNKDRIKDYALVLQTIDSVHLINEEDGNIDTIKTQPRILAIIFGDKRESRFVLQMQSNTFILYHDNPYMDDPFDGLSIDNNVLSINFRIWYSWGSWWTSQVTYKFRYGADVFNLIGFESHSFHRATMESKSNSINFLTKKHKITKGNQGDSGEEEYKEEIEWKTFKLDALKTFQTFLKPFSWDFGDDVTI